MSVGILSSPDCNSIIVPEPSPVLADNTRAGSVLRLQISFGSYKLIITSRAKVRN